MTEAVGVIEVLGMPAALEVADTMTKAAQVQFVRFDSLAAGLVSVIVRGATADVQVAVRAGVSVLRQRVAAYAGHHVIPCPDGNVEAVLPIVRGTSGEEWLID